MCIFFKYALQLIIEHLLIYKIINTYVNDSLTYIHKFMVVACAFLDICLKFDFIFEMIQLTHTLRVLVNDHFSKVLILIS